MEVEEAEVTLGKSRSSCTGSQMLRLINKRVLLYLISMLSNNIY